MIHSVQILCAVVLATSALPSYQFVRQRSSDVNFIRYYRGSLNVIITVPHDGHVSPSYIPDREAGCYSPYSGCVYRHNCGIKDPQICGVSLLSDSYTKSIAMKLRSELKRLTGRYPYVILNRLHRRKMDANREVNEAAFNIQAAINSYNTFTNKINAAKTSIGGRALLLDIHGQTHAANWTEFGYGIYKSRLNSGVFSAAHATIKALGLRVCGTNNACFHDLVRGTTPNSIGHYLSNEGYRVVPSPTFPSPGNNGYYSGGYNVRTHGSRTGGIVDAIQVEIPRQERFNHVRRAKFARALARVVKHFIDDHYNRRRQNTMALRNAS